MYVASTRPSSDQTKPPPVLTFTPHQDGTTTSRTFVHTPSIIEAEEAEEVAVEHLLQVSLDVSEAEMEPLEGLELVCDAGGECADCYVTDIAQEMLDANLLGFLGLDDRWGVDKGPGCGGSVLWGGNVSTVGGLFVHKEKVSGGKSIHP